MVNGFNGNINNNRREIINSETVYGIQKPEVKEISEEEIEGYAEVIAEEPVYGVATPKEIVSVFEIKDEPVYGIPTQEIFSGEEIVIADQPVYGIQTPKPSSPTPIKEEKSTWQKIKDGITNFFKGIGEKIKSWFE
ncbi:hypothetical protein II906_03865 [bacterium]|nr:hypothetical protein [bacterium]